MILSTMEKLIFALPKLIKTSKFELTASTSFFLISEHFVVDDDVVIEVEDVEQVEGLFLASTLYF